MLDDNDLYSKARQIHANEWKELAIKLGFNHAEVSHFEADHPRSVVNQIFHMLVTWRNKQPDDVSQTEALCKALEEVQDRKDGAYASLQSGQPSVGMSENQPRTSQQPITQVTTSCSLSPECQAFDVESKAAATKCKAELKLFYEGTGSYVQLNPWLANDQKCIKDMYSRLQFLNAKGAVPGTQVCYEDILVFMKKRTGKMIPVAVLSGLAGRGKTTLFDKIAFDWAVGLGQVLQKYELVFSLKMFYLEQVSDLVEAVFDQLLAEETAKYMQKGALQSYIEKNADKVLILLDGFDELKTTSLSKSSFGSILKILSRKMCRGCTILVSTRPSYLDRLITKDLVQEPFTHVQVMGFNKEDRREYVNKFFPGEPDKVSGLLSRVNSSNLLSTLAESPMLLLLMCLLWRQDSTLPQTMSDLYHSAFEYVGKRKDLSKEDMSRVAMALGEVALRGLLSPNQELTFKESEFEPSIFGMALKAGIVTRQSDRKRLIPHSIVRFIHKTFQEFCGASYLQNLLKGDKEEFQNTLLEIMSKNVFDFEYLLRFCCGNNEASTLEILKVFQKTHLEDLSFDNRLGHLALHCYFESQCKILPPEEFIQSFVSDHVVIDNFFSDSHSSVRFFLEGLAEQSKADGNDYLAEVKSVDLRHADLSLPKFTGEGVAHIAESLRKLPNLVTLDLSYIDLGGTAALWCKQVRQCRALQHLNLSYCSLNAQDMVHVAVSLRDLPNLVTLNLAEVELDGAAALLCEQVGNCRALQVLNLSDCSLNERNMVHVAESLRDLPNLVTLDLSFNDLGGTAALWCRHLGRCRALQHLYLCCCSLNGQDMVLVGESLCGLPNLITLNLDKSDVGGTAVLWYKQVGQCKPLQHLHLMYCSLNAEDMAHVAELLSGLLNLHTLNLQGNNLSGSAVLWCKQVGQCKALQKLQLQSCSLNGEDMIHVAELLKDLPNLVTLDLSFNDLGGTASLWCKQVGQCKALQDLDIRLCSLNGQDMIHVAESLRDLPNLVKLNLSNNDLSGAAAAFCAEIKMFKALKDLELNSCKMAQEDKWHMSELQSDPGIHVRVFFTPYCPPEMFSRLMEIPIIVPL
ncbi:NLR family CARD domain-containing protein 4-like [Acanthaster planci]|uniref:NLR family CARD domain-containing protein 4-like n=1 Tax=Acanthaster planci TaxID=133434 RepID=A0A8B7YQI0_ACAPL|nr:NLR family CARD domain-containing protein 4-like [Acanthaster planci]